MEHERYRILQHGFVEHANPPNGKENAAYVLSKGVLSSQQILMDCGFILHVPGFNLKSLFGLRKRWSQLWEY